MSDEEIKVYCEERGLNEQELARECASHGTTLEKFIEQFRVYEREQRDLERRRQKFLTRILIATAILNLLSMVLAIVRTQIR